MILFLSHTLLTGHNSFQGEPVEPYGVAAPPTYGTDSGALPTYDEATGWYMYSLPSCTRELSCIPANSHARVSHQLIHTGQFLTPDSQVRTTNSLTKQHVNLIQFRKK